MKLSSGQQEPRLKGSTQLLSTLHDYLLLVAELPSWITQITVDRKPLFSRDLYIRVTEEACSIVARAHQKAQWYEVGSNTEPREFSAVQMW